MTSLRKAVTLFGISFLLIMPIAVLAAPLNIGIAPGVQANSIDIVCFLAVLIGSILDLLWILFIALAIIMFIIAGFEFLSAQGDPAGVEKAKKAMLWGVVGVIVAILAFSIPFFIRNIILGDPNAAGRVCAPANNNAVPPNAGGGNLPPGGGNPPPNAGDGNIPPGGGNNPPPNVGDGNPPPK